MIVLASASESRANILKKMDIPFTQAPTNVSEDLQKSSFPTPQAYCDATCSLKSAALHITDPSLFFLAADTIVISEEGEIFEKPESVDDAKRMWTSYSKHGQALIYTSMCLRRGDRILQRGQTTGLAFRRIEEKEIDEYLSKHYASIRGCSGGMRVLESSCHFVKSFSGCVLNCLGLSPSLLHEMMEAISQ